jgi:hypothetical protein
MIKPTLIAILKKLGLFSVARFLKTSIRIMIKPEFRRQELERRQRERTSQERFLKFKLQYGEILQQSLSSGNKSDKRVLVIGSIRLLEIELGLIKALELAGFELAVLVWHNSQLLKQYYDLTGVKKFLYWDDFGNTSRFLPAAEDVVEKFQSLEELLAFEYVGAHVGKNAAATTLRILKTASLDLTSDGVRNTVTKQVAIGMASAIAAQNIIKKINPNLALSIDTVYSEKGELFDVCLANGVDVIRWHPAHKSNSLMLKRYTCGNRDDNPHSLSTQSWELVRTMKWTEAHHDQLQREMHNSYARGDWYGENATQFDKHFMDADKIRERLGLDPRKKTAFVFPHIFWDASFSWGDNLFDTYEEWFIMTVHNACANKGVNWVIKIHPANLGKGDDGLQEEPAEESTLRRHLGELPPHVFLIPAGSDICTYSLFGLMDYCVTVRGTVGIEAAIRGIPVLTAGTGRYDHKGFSIDSESCEEYLKRIAHIQEIRPLSPMQQELAERYAYGLFILRPLPLTSMTLEFDRANDPDNYFAQTRFNIRNKEDWYTTYDLKAFTEWVVNSKNQDFLISLAEERDVSTP